jgi:hypothetical protein
MDDNTPKISLHSISSLFSKTWTVYKERWSVLVEILLLPTLVMLLGYALMGLDLGFVFSALGGLVILIGGIIFVFSVLPLIFSVHHATGVDASYNATIGWFWPYVWIAILEILAVMGGFFMLIIPGIWLSFSFLFLAYVFVLEKRRGIDALRQSKEYIKGYWWAVVGRAILLGLILIVPTVLIEIPVALIAGRIAGNIVSLALTLFFTPFSAIYYYTIFTNLRELKPKLAEAQTKEGTEFIKVSAIVGLVVPILIMIAAVALVGVGIFSMMRDQGRYAPPPASDGYNNMRSPFQQP